MRLAVARVSEYKCSSCGKIEQREELVVKKALFVTMGAGSSTVRSRVVAWLCPTCRVEDPDWVRTQYAVP